MSKPLTPKEKAKDARLRREFHITLATFKKIFKFQEGKCYICQKSALSFKNGFAVDHNHKTGLVRGLLCVWCNRILGKWLDDDEKVLRAARYVVNPPATQALGAEQYTAKGRIGTKVRAKLLAAMKKSMLGEYEQRTRK